MAQQFDMKCQRQYINIFVNMADSKMTLRPAVTMEKSAFILCRKVERDHVL